MGYEKIHLYKKSSIYTTRAHKMCSLDYCKTHERIFAIATKNSKRRKKLLKKLSVYTSTLNCYMIVGRQDNQMYLYSSLDLKSFESNVLCFSNKMCKYFFKIKHYVC